MTRHYGPVEKRKWRRRTVRAQFTSKEYVLCVGYARVAGKSLSQAVTEAYLDRVLGFEEQHPGVLVAEAERALAAAKKARR